MTNEQRDQPETFLGGVRVLELSDELGEYGGRLLAGLGADVLKVEPPSGSPTRSYGPFLDDTPDPNRSLHFWHYNLGKRSTCIDIDRPHGQTTVRHLASEADVVLTSCPRGEMVERGLDEDSLLRENPRLIYARISPFGDDGPWSHLKASDLVHLALGGMAMNCGYDPDPAGEYDTPPVAPQMWLSYQIAGEMTVFAIMAALTYRLETGQGQYISCSVHDVVSKNTENDLPNWLYLGLEHQRQTCRHSNPSLSPPLICSLKDGRWHLPYRTYMTSAMRNDVPNTARLLSKYGMEADLAAPRYEDPDYIKQPQVAAHIGHVIADFFARICSDAAKEVWAHAQALGLPWAPIRRPEDNVDDPHWTARETFVEVDHPELGRSFTDVGQKWVGTVPWQSDMRVPGLGEHQPRWLDRARSIGTSATREEKPSPPVQSWRGKPFALASVRIIDLSWLLASGGAGRFFAALGAEVVKVEHHSRPDHGRGSWVGRVPLPQGATADSSQLMNRSGAFMEINAGKLSLSLDLKRDEGKELLFELLRDADAVLSGFSPGTMARLGLGYETLRELNQRLVVVEQSAVGALGIYGAIRGYGPTAQALSGLSEMSGLPEPFPPAGIGYSFLDWYGAYNVANAVMAGIVHARVSGRGCHIDASQVEAGIYLTGTAILDHSANQHRWTRYGNRSPYKPGAPHGIYRAAGTDRWIAISCFTDEEWEALARALGQPEWLDDERFATLADRLANQDPLDQLVANVTQTLEPYELMDALQTAGVAAGVCQTAQDRCERDPQLAHDGWLVELPQTDIGTWPVKEAPFTMSLTPPAMGGRLQRHGPSYGEDSDYVLRELLHLDEARVRSLREGGVVDR